MPDSGAAMTNLLLNHPVAAFYLGVFILAMQVGWVLCLVAQGITAHLQWKALQSTTTPRTGSTVPRHAADSVLKTRCGPKEGSK